MIMYRPSEDTLHGSVCVALEISLLVDTTLVVNWLVPSEGCVMRTQAADLPSSMGMESVLMGISNSMWHSSSVWQMRSPSSLKSS